MSIMDGYVEYPDTYIQKYQQAGYWEGRVLGDILDQTAAKYPERIAISDENGRHITYARFLEMVNRLALHLIDMQHKPLDRLILQLPNVPETLFLYFAAVKVGLIPVMTLPAHRQAEIGYFADFAGAVSYAVAQEFRGFDYMPMAREIKAQTSGLKNILVLGDQVPPEFTCLADLLNDPIETRVACGELLKNARPDPLWPAVFQLSGGTTGIPKLIPRTHSDYYYNSLRCRQLSHTGPETVYLIGIPITHNFPTSFLQGVFMAGGKVVIASSPAPDIVLPLIEAENVTTLPAVPATIISYMNHPDLKHHDISSLKLCQVGGSKLLPEAAREVGPRLGADVQQILGMAEGPNFITRLDDPEEVKFFTQGRALSAGDEIRIVDEEGQPVPLGEMGELLVRGPYTIRGYFKSPEHNAKAFTAEGFYKSGDLVRMHPSGNLEVGGRIKDTINRGGEKISAEEMENHILSFPKLLNCAYVAMPDPVLGEKACLFAVVREGQTLSAQELNDFLLYERKIAKFKLPERLEVVNQLPLTHVGKINKKTLRRIIAEKLEAETKR